MADLRQTDSTTSSVTVQCYGLDSTHNRNRYFVWDVYYGQTYIKTEYSTMTPGGTTHSKTITGLDDDTTYNINCGIYDDDQYQTLLWDGYVAASTDPETPATNAYIWTGSAWTPATPYIWNGSTWVQATANIYSGGWQS